MKRCHALRPAGSCLPRRVLPIRNRAQRSTGGISSGCWRGSACSRSIPSASWCGPTICRCYARLGPYPPLAARRCRRDGKRLLFEYWAHEASLLPVESYPLLRWRMARARAARHLWRARPVRARAAGYVEEVYREVVERGPDRRLRVRGRAQGHGGWWGWSDAKHALEWLFWAGRDHHGRAAAQLRAPLRPARAGAAAGGA